MMNFPGSAANVVIVRSSQTQGITWSGATSVTTGSGATSDEITSLNGLALAAFANLVVGVKSGTNSSTATFQVYGRLVSGGTLYWLGTISSSASNFEAVASGTGTVGSLGLLPVTSIIVKFTVSQSETISADLLGLM